MMAIINYLVAIPILVIGAYSDVKYREAKNILWLIMGIIGIILLLIPPYDLLYIAIMIIIIILLFVMFYCLPSIGGADIKAMMALSILFPYPIGASYLPPIYPILIYSFIVELASIPIVKFFNREKTFIELFKNYPFPFLVSLLGGVIVLFFIGDITVY